MQTQTNLMIAFLGIMNPNAMQLFQQLQSQVVAPPAQLPAPVPQAPQAESEVTPTSTTSAQQEEDPLNSDSDSDS